LKIYIHISATYSINYRGLQDVCVCVCVCHKSRSHTLCYHSFVAYCKTRRSLLGPLATESPCIIAADLQCMVTYSQISKHSKALFKFHILFPWSEKISFIATNKNHKF